jgi:ribosomal protein L31
VDICSSCHPVYSGKRSEATRGSDRVDQFRRKYGSFLTV